MTDFKNRKIGKLVKFLHCPATVKKLYFYVLSRITIHNNYSLINYGRWLDEF